MVLVLVYLLQDLLEAWGVLRLASWIRDRARFLPSIIIPSKAASDAHIRSKQQIERQGPTFARNPVLTASIALSTLTPAVIRTETADDSKYV